ncbi:MAG: hypothetical protein U0992_01365 [Planctomycetaceae bacterium]
MDGIVTGDPLNERTQMGPLVHGCDAQRVAEWIDEAVHAAQRLLAAVAATAFSTSRQSSTK